MPAVRAVQGDWHWPLQQPLKKRWIFPPVTWAHNLLQLRQSQPTFRPTNHKRVMPTNWRPYLPTDSPTATRPGLCSSLVGVTLCCQCWPWLQASQWLDTMFGRPRLMETPNSAGGTHFLSPMAADKSWTFTDNLTTCTTKGSGWEKMHNDIDMPHYDTPSFWYTRSILIKMDLVKKKSGIINNTNCTTEWAP